VCVEEREEGLFSLSAWGKLKKKTARALSAPPLPRVASTRPHNDAITQGGASSTPPLVSLPAHSASSYLCRRLGLARQRGGRRSRCSLCTAGLQLGHQRPDAASVAQEVDFQEGVGEHGLERRKRERERESVRQGGERIACRPAREAPLVKGGQARASAVPHPLSTHTIPLVPVPGVQPSPRPGVP